MLHISCKRKINRSLRQNDSFHMWTQCVYVSIWYTTNIIGCYYPQAFECTVGMAINYHLCVNLRDSVAQLRCLYMFACLCMCECHVRWNGHSCYVRLPYISLKYSITWKCETLFNIVFYWDTLTGAVHPPIEDELYFYDSISSTQQQQEKKKAAKYFEWIKGVTKRWI